jgi:hypothetical protein
VRLVRGFGRFWWDFIVGDEWRMAVVVACATVVGAVAASGAWVGGRGLAVAMAAGVMLVVAAILIGTGRRRRA